MNDQRSLNDQLLDLVVLANKHGLYDAADWLKTQVKTEPVAGDVFDFLTNKHTYHEVVRALFGDRKTLFKPEDFDSPSRGYFEYPDKKKGKKK